MDPNTFKSTMSDLNFGTVLGAAARDYQKELMEQQKAQASASIHQEVDLDDLLNDPELESLHAERIAALRKETEKRQVLERKGHGEYRDVVESDFLAEVTGSEKVVCHFYHHEFVRCKIVDKHLKILAPRYFDTKFIRLDAESPGAAGGGGLCKTKIASNGCNSFVQVLCNCKTCHNTQNAPFFVTKLAIKTLPCIILFRDGVAFDRLVGFQDLGGVDDFPTSTLESWLLRKGVATKKKGSDEVDPAEAPRRVRSTTYADSDSE